MNGKANNERSDKQPAIRDGHNSVSRGIYPVL